MHFSATLLISRQALFPCAKTEWICAVNKALSWIGRCGYRLISSCGMQTWDVQTVLASERNLPLELILPVEAGRRASTIKHLCRELNLSERKTSFHTFTMGNSGRSKQRCLSCRDRLVVSVSDIVVPISIRPGGRLEELLKTAGNDGKVINSDFQVPYSTYRSRVAYTVHGSDFARSADAALSGYLIHWTRTHRSPWPGETAFSFYSNIIRSPEYPRTAFDTLRNILTEKKIRATGLHMRDKHPAVSFTDETPSVFADRMRWRSRFRVMSFEPYGIGIRKDSAKEFGILPVLYETDPQTSEDIPSWRLQSQGKKTDWRGEREFRCSGDFDFAGIDPSVLCCICPTRGEADRLFKAHKIPSFALYGNTTSFSRSPEGCFDESVRTP